MRRRNYQEISPTQLIEEAECDGNATDTSSAEVDDRNVDPHEDFDEINNLFFLDSTK